MSKQEYDQNLDKVLWTRDFPKEGMRVTAHSYDGKPAKFSLIQIYEDRKSGEVKVSMINGYNGPKQKSISRLSVAQINALFNLVQEEIQEGNV